MHAYAHRAFRRAGACVLRPFVAKIAARRYNGCMKKRTLVFDFDMTLGYRSPMWTETVRLLLLRHNVFSTDEQVIPITHGDVYPWHFDGAARAVFVDLLRSFGGVDQHEHGVVLHFDYTAGDRRGDDVLLAVAAFDGEFHLAGHDDGHPIAMVGEDAVLPRLYRHDERRTFALEKGFVHRQDVQIERFHLVASVSFFAFSRASSIVPTL